jgi:hypothetical protein
MKEFLLLLFFSKTVLLTPDVVSIDGTLEIIPDEPISALNANACILIDLKHSYPSVNIKNKGIYESREFLRSQFPEGSISAMLFADSKTVELKKSSFSLSNEASFIMLKSEDGIPLGYDFSKVVIGSKVRVNNVQVFWKNSAE